MSRYNKHVNKCGATFIIDTYSAPRHGNVILTTTETIKIYSEEEEEEEEILGIIIGRKEGNHKKAAA